MHGEPAQGSSRTGPLVATAASGARCMVCRVLDGPDRGREHDLSAEPLVVGKSSRAGLVVRGPGVSREHVELRGDGREVTARDLGSTNGTYVAGVRITTARVEPGAVLRLGAVHLQIVEVSAAAGLERPPGFDELVGDSPALRAALVQLARVAPTPSTLLITGETGTGKDLAARLVHRASSRRDRPLVPVDLGALAADVAEVELFGHEAGAFTGAVDPRTGAIERSAGGTLLLDELGELPLPLQPLLLRFLETRQIRRVGGARYRTVDARVICATHRDLRADVAAGRFRDDLFYRCAIVTVRLPPLRERRDDVPALVDRYLADRAARERAPAPRISARAMDVLIAADWPGNVRQLRNVLERVWVVCGAGAQVTPRHLELDHDGAGRRAVVPFHDAKEALIAAWERDYVADLLARVAGNVTLAARRAGLARGHLYRLLTKHGLV